MNFIIYLLRHCSLASEAYLNHPNKWLRPNSEQGTALDMKPNEFSFQKIYAAAHLCKLHDVMGNVEAATRFELLANSYLEETSPGHHSVTNREHLFRLINQVNNSGSKAVK